MITILGTAHVMDLKVLIEDKIKEVSPDIICVELDYKRLAVLKMLRENENGNKTENSQKNKKQYPSMSYRILAWFQNAMAKKFQGQAGADMITAIETAEKLMIPIIPIDMDSEAQLKKAMATLNFKERAIFILSLVRYTFARKEQIESDLKKVMSPGGFDKDSGKQGVFKNTRKNDYFESFFDSLLYERNEYMAKKIIESSTRFENIMVITGDMHVEGIAHELEKRFKTETNYTLSVTINNENYFENHEKTKEFNNDSKSINTPFEIKNEIKKIRLFDYYPDLTVK